MKKFYVKPVIVNHKFSMEEMFLAASVGVETGLRVGDEYEESDVTYSKKYGNISCWDDDDEVVQFPML